MNIWKKSVRSCSIVSSPSYSSFPSVAIVLLTDDIANRDHAREEGLIAFTCKFHLSLNRRCSQSALRVVKEYLSTFNRPELLDRLVLKEESFDLEKDIGKRKEVSGSNCPIHWVSHGNPFQITFPEHLPLSEVQRGLKSGKYLQGSFQASRENYLEANVFVQDSEKYNQVKQHRSVHSRTDLCFLHHCSCLSKVIETWIEQFMMILWLWKFFQNLNGRSHSVWWLMIKMMIKEI